MSVVYLNGDFLPVGDAKVAPKALDRDVSAKLWAASEDLLGEKFNVPDQPAIAAAG